MKDMEITPSNWNLARFSESDTLAFISLGAKPGKSDQIDYVYSLIVANSDYQEMSEQCFDSLEEAIKAINTRFSHWKLTILGEKAKGGCGDCAAH